MSPTQKYPQDENSLNEETVDNVKSAPGTLVLYLFKRNKNTKYFDTVHTALLCMIHIRSLRVLIHALNQYCGIRSRG